MEVQNEQVKNYVEILLSERGFSDELPDEIKEQLRQDMFERLNNYFIARIVELFPAEKLEELEKKIDMGIDEKVWTYVRDNLPNFDVLTIDLLSEFRTKYLGA